MQKRMVITRRCLDVVDGIGGLPPGVPPRTISLDEWLAHVAASPALTRVRLAANEEDVLRAAYPVRLVDRSTDGWLYWAAGEIRANGPDPAMLAAMLVIAHALDARMRHDNREYFRVPDAVLPRDRCTFLTDRIDEERSPEEEEAMAERRATQALVVAGTIACVASVMWMMQA